MLSVENNRFRFQFKYDPAIVDAVKSLNGRRYDPKTKTWVCPPSPEAVAIARSYGMDIDPKAIEMCRPPQKPELDTNMTSVITNRDMLPWAHQVAMVNFTVQSRIAALWHCGMGTGKTRAAIDYMQTTRPRKVLIVCPLAVVPAWQKQFSMFSVIRFEVCTLNAHSVKKKVEIAHQAIRLAEARNHTIPVIIINYESLWREPFGSWALSQTWPLVILDEGHYIKSPGGKASRFCERLGRKAERRIALTGTPFPHSPIDIYGLYRFLDPSIFGTNNHQFKMRYAVLGGFKGKQIVAYQNTREFYHNVDKIRIYVSRDVLDLPPAIHTDITFTLPSAVQKIYSSLETDFVAMVKSGEVTVSNALAKLLRLQQITSGHLPVEGKIEELHKEKGNALQTLLEGLEQEEPVVVFCRFAHDIKMVHSVCNNIGRVCCELSGGKKELEAWQAGQGSVLATQIRTGREGIDLTRAHYCVYFSLGFSLAEYEQSLARCHRPGQTKTMFYYHIIAENTVDAKVYSSLKARKQVIESILADV